MTATGRRLNKSDNEKLRNFNSSPTIIGANKSRKMKWAGYVARMRRCEVCIEFRLESLKERNHSKDLDVDG
jgi:hypothetical protein